MMKSTSLVIPVVVASLALSARAGDPAPSVPTSDSGSVSAALDVFGSQHPGAGFHRFGGRITSVYGPAFGAGTDALDTAERFRLGHAGLFGVAAANLLPESFLADRRHTQPVMFEPAIGAYKFTLVYYHQYQDGIPVYRADLRLLIRNEPGHPLVLATSGLRDLGAFRPQAALLANLAQPGFVNNQYPASQRAVADAAPGMIDFSPPEITIWAGVDDMVVEPRVALVFVADNFGPGGAADQKWRFITDIQTGAILHQETLLHQTDIVGNVSGVGSRGLAAEQCEIEVPIGMPYARVSIGGTVAIADANGDFTIPNPGTLPVTVQSEVRGRWFRVFNAAGTNGLLSQSVTPPGPANFLHNAANTDATRRAEVNAYIAANDVRDFALTYNPAYPTLQGLEFTVRVNRTDGFCPGNAWYDSGVPSINFCLAGGGFPNTAWTNVVYHEYGHHLVQAAGSGQGAYGEGMGDVVAELILDDPRLGLGFFGGCTNFLRNGNNTLQYPCSSTIHTCGQVLSGAVWDTRNALLATNPGSYLDIVSNLAINSIALHSGSSITPEIAIHFLTLDDDDGNIANGTPHYDEICAGFGAHSLDCPLLEFVGFEYPNGRPDFVTPNQPTVIRVNTVPSAGTPIPGSGAVSFRFGVSGPFSTVAMTEISPNQYEATLPAAACPTTIQYFFSASTFGGQIGRDPIDAPASTFAAVAAVGTIPVLSLNFETNPSWTVSGNALDGQWNRGVPVNCQRGDPPADFDGSGQCMLTDNSAAGACNSDVDDGVTTLTSQPFDVSGGGLATYSYWLNDVPNGALNGDALTVEMATNAAGTNWQLLRSYTTASGAWRTDTIRVGAEISASPTMRIRFSASDVGSQNVVEAAIDAFSVTRFDCPPPCPPADGDLDGNGRTDGLDIQVLLDAMLVSATPQQICSGDFNGSGALESGDVPGMVAVLLAP